MSYQADPTKPNISTNDKNQSLLPTNSKPLEHALAGISAKLEPIPVPFEAIWDVDKAPNELLPYLAFAWSVDQWNDNWSIDTQRAVIKSSIWVHQRKGTLGAVKRALSAMGYDAKVMEWWQKNPVGNAGTFSIEVHPTKGIVTDTLNQIRAVIDSVKRLSAHYDIFLGLSTQNHANFAGISCVGVQIFITD